MSAILWLSVSVSVQLVLVTVAVVSGRTFRLSMERFCFNQVMPESHTQKHVLYVMMSVK